MKILTIDIGVLTSRSFSAAKRYRPSLTAKKMVVGVKASTKDWNYDVVSLGYPGPVLRSRLSWSHTIWEVVGWASTINVRLESR